MKWTAGQLKGVIDGMLGCIMHEFDPFGQVLRKRYPERLLGCLRIGTQEMVKLYGIRTLH